MSGELIANNDTATTPANTPVAIDVLANDTLNGDPVTIGDLAGPPTVLTAPSGGTAVWNPATNRFDYTPAPGFCGTDTFEYEVATIPPPANLAPPVISGTLLVGDTLTATPGVWSGADTVIGEWFVNGIATGNTTTTYVIQLADAGKPVEYRETATNGAGSVTQASNTLTAADLRTNVQSLYPKYSGIGGMWDFADISTLRQLGDGSVAVTSVADPVGWVADLNTGAYPAYQNTAAKRPAYNGAGVKPDGVDDCFVTASIDFTPCDKMVAAMGYVKGSNIACMQLELSSNSNNNAGTFYVVSGEDVGRHNVSISRGSAPSNANQAAFFPAARADGYGAHISRHSIPGALSEVWWNVAKGTDGTANKGADTFGDYPLFIFARNQTSLYSNTPARRAIVLGIPVAEAQMSNADIALIDAWLSEGAV